MSPVTEKKFKRVFQKNQQENLLKTPLYTKLLDDIIAGEIFPAFRNNTIDFYYKGGNVFKFKHGLFSTHMKYASVLHEHDKPYISETELKEAKLITDFMAGYPRIKENCSLYSGVEAAGVSKLFSKSSYALQNPKIDIPNIVVLDIEVSLKALDDVETDLQEKQNTQDRIDLLLYNKKARKLQFFEVKHFSNSEIWSEKGTKPAVVKQVKRYNRQLVNKHEDILNAYKEYVKAARVLFGLSELDLPDPKHLADEVILLVFGFDSHQKNKIDELLIKDKSLLEISRRFLGNLTSASEVWKERAIKRAWVTVLKVGCEGGSITLLGQDNGDDAWKYKLTTNETAMSDLLSEEDAEGMDFSSASHIVEDWDSIIQLLGRKYPHWMDLYQVECHPLFRNKVSELRSVRNRASKAVMNTKNELEKARQLFQEAGFELPAIPDVLANRIKQRKEMLFSTRAKPKSPNFTSFYVDEVSNNKVGDYALISYSRNGRSWMAIHYFLVFGPLRMFLELGRGGMYTDDEGDAIQVANIRECFLLADKIVPATMAMCKANDRLTIFCSDFHGSYWVAPSQDAQKIERRCHCPKDVLSEVLQWLGSSEEDGMNFMEYVRKHAEEMDGKEKEEFLAMAEQIDREEDEFEQRKILYLSDYRKQLGKK